MIEEKEIKILLNEEEYNKILNFFVWNKEYTQNNYYYGNLKETSAKSANTIRIREKKGKIFLQVKIRKVERGSLHIQEEYERELEDIPSVVSKLELKELTEYDFPSDVYLLGVLSTTRRECCLFPDIIICLDKNNYFEMEDYEVEIEFTQYYPSQVIGVLKEIGIITNRKARGKYTRFLEKKDDEQHMFGKSKFASK